MAVSDSTFVGRVYGNLTVLRQVGSHRAGRIVEARCDCGNLTTVNINNLRTGHTKSCGCARGRAAQAVITHGHTRRGHINRTYSIYRDMRTRCENPNYKEFYLYGGRGIEVCDRWRHGYEFFLADMGERPPGMTLERVNVNLGYSPENCRWATVTEQANNKRNSAFIEYGGKRQTVAQWAEELGINAKKIYFRRSRGLPPETCLKK